MTFKEKLQEEYPEYVGDGFNRFIGGGASCPHAYGYEEFEDSRDICLYIDCEDCWDREMPEGEV